MVAKLPLPENDCIELLRLVLAERVKYKKFYTRIAPELTRRYQLYEQEKGCPSNIPPLDLNVYVKNPKEAEGRKKSLIGLYSPKNGIYPYDELEKLRKKNKLLACPVCGEPGRPRTLDHCLPKTTYPEFSINFLNLVPACDWCQGEKLADYKTDAGTRSFIHPYFDDVNQPLYAIKLQPPYITPVISLEMLTTLPLSLQQLVSTHLHGIGFWERFKEHFETSYQSILRLASKTREAGKLTVTEMIENALELSIEKGINSWDAVLYRSILEDADALLFLENGKLPELP